MDTEEAGRPEEVEAAVAPDTQQPPEAESIVINLTPEQLHKLFEEEEQKRQDAFVAEYNALCAKHGYAVAPQLTLKIVKLAPANKG